MTENYIFAEFKYSTPTNVLKTLFKRNYTNLRWLHAAKKLLIRFVPLVDSYLTADLNLLLKAGVAILNSYCNGKNNQKRVS